MQAALIGFLILTLSGLPAKAQPAAVTHLWFESPPEIVEGGRLINEGRAQEGIDMILSVMDTGLPLKFQAHAYTNLCGGHLHLENYNKAIKYCRRAIKFDSSIWQAHSNRGAAHFALGRYGKAIQDFKRAIELEPENPTLKQNLALAERRESSIIKH